MITKGMDGQEAEKIALRWTFSAGGDGHEDEMNSEIAKHLMVRDLVQQFKSLVGRDPTDDERAWMMRIVPKTIYPNHDTSSTAQEIILPVVIEALISDFIHSICDHELHKATNGQYSSVASLPPITMSDFNELLESICRDMKSQMQNTQFDNLLCEFDKTKSTAEGKLVDEISDYGRCAQRE